MEVDPVLIIVVIGSVGALFIERVFYYRSKYMQRNNKRPNPGNPEIEPGKGDICIENGNRLTKIEEQIKGIRDDIEEIKRKLNRK